MQLPDDDPQNPLRQTVAALPPVHGPPPKSYPQALSPVLHTPLTHTRAPTAVEQVLLIGATLGKGCGLVYLSAHVPAAAAPDGLLHHRPGQSVSVVQRAPQACVVALQIGPA